MSSERSILPPHIEDTVRSIAEVHAQHHRRTSPYQRLIAKLTDAFGRPVAAAVIVVFIVVWIGWNVTVAHLRFGTFDPAPFSYLQLVLSACALLMTVFILTAQRHEDQLAERRDQLTLELAMISEQKVAKLIALIESLRRDHPQMTDRVDEEAAAMSTPADPHAIFEAIQETHGALIADDAPAESRTPAK